MLSKVWPAKDLSKALKIEVFKALVLNTSLCNSETWVLKLGLLKQHPRNRLKVFNGVFTGNWNWNKKTKNPKYREPKLIDLVQRCKQTNWQRRLNYFRHVARLNTQRYIDVESYGHGRGRQGRQKKRWINTIKVGETPFNLYDADQSTDREVLMKSVRPIWRMSTRYQVSQ